MPPEHQLSLLSCRERRGLQVHHRLRKVTLKVVAARSSGKHFVALVDVAVSVELTKRDLLGHVAQGHKSVIERNRRGNPEVLVSQCSGNICPHNIAGNCGS